MTQHRVILHSDMNSFFASVEMMLDPSLKGKAVAVCDATEERNGIVLAKSELAKKYGVKTGMVNWEARQRRPGLILVPPQYNQCWKYSKLAHQIYYRYSRVMHKDFVSLVKSIGRGITCTADLENEEEVHRVLLELSQDVGHRPRAHNLWACGVQIAVRGNDLLVAQFQCKLPFKTQLPSEIASAGFRLFQERYRWGTNVRAVCIRAIDLTPQNEVEQLDIFIDTARCDKRARLEDAIEELRDRFGKRTVTYATLLGDLKMPDDGRHSVKMPGLMYQ